MNKCELTITNADGTTARQYIAGYEVRIGTPDIGRDDPLDIIDELLKACSGEIADVGGISYIGVGGPDLPVAFVTDEDFLRTAPQDLDPFPSADETYNGVHATFPTPAELWQPKEAPPRYDPNAEAEDGARLIADIGLPAVPYGLQVQRLMAAWLKGARRFRRHNGTVGPWGSGLAPLQSIAWTSVRNGYIDKAFEIGQLVVCSPFAANDPQPLGA